MTKDEARKAAEVMLAYADGKEVQVRDQGGWGDCNSPSFNWDGYSDNYRIKPEPHYRPFKSADECWQEMQKHQPFGWVRGTFTKGYVQIQYVMDSDEKSAPVVIHFAPDEEFNEKESFEHYEFADGTPFGMMEE